MEKSYSVDQWVIEEAKDVSMEYLWTWYKVDVTDADGYPFLSESCNDFDKEFWFNSHEIPSQ